MCVLNLCNWRVLGTDLLHFSVNDGPAASALSELDHLGVCCCSRLNNKRRKHMFKYNTLEMYLFSLVTTKATRR